MSVGKGELLKRSLEKGTSLIDMTRERAEVLVKELVDAGVVRKGQAEKAIDVVVERSRKRSEALGNLIRHEVAEQLSAFGVATKDDIARLESKLEGSDGTPAGAASRVKPPSPRTKAAPITKSARTKGTLKSAQGPEAPPAMKPAEGRRAGRGAEPSGAR
jgi:polyhydroxyalkanoate synthesis regulator phasin